MLLNKPKIKKIAVIFGTRPEAIKMAPVIKELKRYPRVFNPLICITAQHREMLDEVLKLFNIKPRYDLDIMRNNQSPFEVTAKGLFGIRKVLEAEKPHAVLVQGDTTTTFAASLAAFYLKIPVGHIEAGLRTNNKYSPFPEEINRRLTSHLADFHFTPTQRAKQNLISEGILRNTVFFTGNTIIDAVSQILKQNKKNKKLRKRFPFVEYKNKRLILVTAHRRENFGKPLENICLAIRKLAEKNKEIFIVYPVHPNPNVKETVYKILGSRERINLIEPLDYPSFVYLMNKAYFILTDSGGVQEEASSLGKPVLVMRENTERQEVIEAGVGRLVGTNVDKILDTAKQLLSDKKVYNNMAQSVNIFGEGNAAQKIVKIIKEKLI